MNLQAYELVKISGSVAVHRAFEFCYRIFQLTAMENLTFLVTLLCGYASLAWSLRLPNVLDAWQRFFTSCLSPPDDDAVKSRLQEYRQNHMPDWVPIFTKTGEIYLVVWTLLRLSFPAAWTKPAWQDLHMPGLGESWGPVFAQLHSGIPSYPSWRRPKYPKP